jgi:hypothetical protein
MAVDGKHKPVAAFEVSSGCNSKNHLTLVAVEVVGRSHQGA